VDCACIFCVIFISQFFFSDKRFKKEEEEKKRKEKLGLWNNVQWSSVEDA